jgi:hypothetical protein
MPSLGKAERTRLAWLSWLGEFALFGSAIGTLRVRATTRLAAIAARASSQTTTTTKMAQTTLDDWAKDPVDPEIRAHVYSLISAVSIATLHMEPTNTPAARWYWR